MDQKNYQQKVEPEPEKTPTQLLVEEAKDAEAVREAIRAIVRDSRRPKAEKQYSAHAKTLKYLARQERLLTQNYGVTK